MVAIHGCGCTLQMGTFVPVLQAIDEAWKLLPLAVVPFEG